MSETNRIHFDENVCYDCSQCTWCCDQPWDTRIEPEKAEAVKAHDWSVNHPRLSGRELVVPRKLAKRRYLALTKGQGTRCVFLDDDGLCIIHKELGPEAKPDGCLQFPMLRTSLPDGDYVSANFGCRAVQESKGRPLPEHADSLPQTLPIDVARELRLCKGVALTSEEVAAIAGRLCEIFTGDPLNVWDAFATGLVYLIGVARYQGADREEALAGRDMEKLDQPEVPAVAAPASPMECPMDSRMLFMANLYADAFPHILGDPSFFQRMGMIPKLMSLGQLQGTLHSTFLDRDVAVREVWGADFGEDLEQPAHQFLGRYFRSRLWQRFFLMRGLSLMAGYHQMLLDLNVVLLYARAEGMAEGKTILDEALIKRGVHIVEFQIANQTRLFEQVLGKYLVPKLESPTVAVHSLRLMRGRSGGNAGN